MNKIEIVKQMLRNASSRGAEGAEGVAWASSNIALVKYWGKRDTELNLPMNASLSVSLGDYGALTRVKLQGGSDRCWVNGVALAEDCPFMQRISQFLDLFRGKGAAYSVITTTNLPVAAGFASSACGFAALVQALNNLYGWQFDRYALSVLARLGSGSASRSIFEGFVEWQHGQRADGMDSYGIPLEYVWPDLRIGLLVISAEEKPLSSREAMARTVANSPYYAAWLKQVENDLFHLKLALVQEDFELFGEVTENNSLAMHAVMGAAQPSINYSLPATLQAMTQIQALRKSGIPVFFTQDAGPNLVLLFLAEQEREIVQAFPQLKVITPFSRQRATEVIIVDHADQELRVGEKLAVHRCGELHRAFSVVILRKRHGEWEFLLQQRSGVKYHSPGCWSNACCGHPLPGETVVAAGERRLFEELGVALPLRDLVQFHYQVQFPELELHENELDHLLVGFSDQEEFAFNPAEVQACGWQKITALQEELQRNPLQYTAWLPWVMRALMPRLDDL